MRAKKKIRALWLNFKLVFLALLLYSLLYPMFHGRPSRPSVSQGASHLYGCRHYRHIMMTKSQTCANDFPGFSIQQIGMKFVSYDLLWNVEYSKECEIGRGSNQDLGCLKTRA